ISLSILCVNPVLPSSSSSAQESPSQFSLRRSRSVPNMVSLDKIALPPKAKEVVIEETVLSDNADEPVDPNMKKKLGTSYDRRDMLRMGKRQELRVRDMMLMRNTVADYLPQRN